MEGRIDCQDFHDDCFKTCSTKLIDAIKYTSKLYAIAHGAPLLIFKFKELKARPIQTLYRLADSIVRSMGFLCGYIMTIRIFHCYVFSKLLHRFNCKYNDI